MKNIDCKTFEIQDLSPAELLETNGGSEFSDAVIRLIGFVFHACADNSLESVNLAHGH
jgi:hypothetical protein